MNERLEKRERYRKPEERLIRFASDCIDIAERLPRTVAGRYYADQLVRSSGSPRFIMGKPKALKATQTLFIK